MQQKQQRPQVIFSACAPSDSRWLEQWEAHLCPLEQAGIVSFWSARHLQPGTDRGKLLYDHLDQADIIILLLSTDFFVDDECCSVMERALERHQQGTTRVIPLLLRPVAWRETKLAAFTPLPSNGSPVTQWHDPEAAFDGCVRNLRHVLGRPTTTSLADQRKRVSLEEQNRVRMLGRLRRSYGEMMSQSLQGTAWLELGLAEIPAAVQNAAHLLLRMPHRAEQPLPLDTSIMQVYDEAEHELLILGEPGAGKSTLLLSLAQQLLVRAEQDQTHRLPVILPLSSWAVKRLPLQDWIAEQLAQIYDVPHMLSVQWVQEGGILPLLDGLDEMEETARAACIMAINTYHRDHLAELVVCSRTTEYEAAALHHCLTLQGAVMVQPLTHEDVDAYLVRAGKPLTALRSALKKNATLHDLATTPLMLSVLFLAYQGIGSTITVSGQLGNTQQQVFDAYAQRMLTRRYAERYTPEQTVHWLTYLAQQMK